MGEIVIIVIAFGIYFLPTIVGKNIKNINAIFALNLLLG